MGNLPKFSPEGYQALRRGARMTHREVAEMLGISERTARSWGAKKGVKTANRPSRLQWLALLFLMDAITAQQLYKALKSGNKTKMDITQETMKEALTRIAKGSDSDLFSMTQDEIASEWYWSWDENRSVEYNTYEFSKILEMHKRRWRRWEEHHNGASLVVERVRDKYVMPRVRDFLSCLAQENTATSLQFLSALKSGNKPKGVKQ